MRLIVRPSVNGDGNGHGDGDADGDNADGAFSVQMTLMLTGHFSYSAVDVAQHPFGRLPVYFFQGQFL